MREQAAFSDIQHLVRSASRVRLACANEREVLKDEYSEKHLEWAIASVLYPYKIVLQDYGIRC
jgi:hypothetical protein